jgi:tetratricopeptide (TPR) repeat protein
MRSYLLTSLMVLLLVQLPRVVGAAAESAEALRQSKTLFEAARVEYRAGRYRPALELFTRALQLTWRPSIVLNLAQCHRRLGNDEAALAHYRQYLAHWSRAAPRRPPPFETEVRRHIATLSAKLERRRSAPVATAPASPGNGPAAAPATSEAWQVELPSASTGQGELLLVGMPKGAWVRVDGELRAQATDAELHFTLMPGDHELEVQAEGFSAWRRVLQLTAGQRRRESVVLLPVRAPARLWLVAGIGSGALALSAEVLALYFTAKANRELRSSLAFDGYRSRAIASHVAAGVLAGSSALSFWLWYRAQNAAETPAVSSGQASPGPALSLLPSRTGAVLVGQVLF